MPKNSLTARLTKALLWLEDGLLVALLVLMLILAASQIILRNLFDAGILWGDPALRALVLWAALFGAMVASRQGEHINIDLFTRIKNLSARRWINSIRCFATAVIGAMLAYHSYRFVLLEYEDGLTAFANIPNWTVAGLLPLAFGVITLRYLILTYRALRYPDSFDDSSNSLPDTPRKQPGDDFNKETGEP